VKERESHCHGTNQCVKDDNNIKLECKNDNAQNSVETWLVGAYLTPASAYANTDVELG